MLEYDFNQLDDDFITLWSRYLVNNNYKEISKNLEKLAELGQINAIQSWYLWNSPGSNDIIDRNCQNLGNDSNSIYAKANHDYCGVMEWFEKLKPEYPTTQFIATDYYQYVTYALLLAQSEYKKSKNPLIRERWLEMRLATPFRNSDETIRNTEHRRIQDMAIILRSDLSKLVSQHPSSQTKFALAKNKFFFDGEKRERREGLIALAELGERDFSKQLTDYICQGKKINRDANNDDDFCGEIYTIPYDKLGLN